MKTLLSIRLIPGARQESLEQLPDGSWKARLLARAIEGKANVALCKKMAAWLELSPSQVTLLCGQKSRQKIIQVTGLEMALIQDRLHKKLL